MEAVRRIINDTLSPYAASERFLDAGLIGCEKHFLRMACATAEIRKLVLDIFRSVGLEVLPQVRHQFVWPQPAYYC